MLNLPRTLALVKGALFDRVNTWERYLPEADNWLKTVVLMTGPLIVVSALLSYLIGVLGIGSSVFGVRPTILSTLVSMISAALATAVVAFIASALSGVFGGKTSFALGLAAATLSFVPGYLAPFVTWLPWLGGLIGFGLFIYSLVLLWRIIPLYLEVPEARRVGHYVSTIIASIVTMVIVSLLMRPILAPIMPSMATFSGSDRDAPSSVGGMFGEAMRQGQLLAEAEEDQFDPPSSGRLKESQVRDFARTASRAVELLEEKAERMRELSERAEGKEELSMSDMTEMMSGATSMMGMNTVELEVVKSGGGNWAEYQWVKNSLRTAYIQRDNNETTAHNYALYKKYEDELQPIVAR